MAKEKDTLFMATTFLWIVFALLCGVATRAWIRYGCTSLPFKWWAICTILFFAGTMVSSLLTISVDD